MLRGISRARAGTGRGRGDFTPCGKLLARLRGERLATWFLYHGFLLMAAQAIAGKFAETFKEFPARQKAASFTIDDALAKMGDAAGGGGH